LTKSLDPCRDRDFDYGDVVVGVGDYINPSLTQRECHRANIVGIVGARISPVANSDVIIETLISSSLGAEESFPDNDVFLQEVGVRPV